MERALRSERALSFEAQRGQERALRAERALQDAQRELDILRREMDALRRQFGGGPVPTPGA